MQINKLEVKNISYYKRGSEETPCYNATVYINGKKAVEVSNDGCGGCDRQHTYPESAFNLREINDWCINTFGKETWEYNGKTYSTDLDLEHYCQQELYNWLDTKLLKKELKSKYLCIEKEKDEEFIVSFKKHLPTEKRHDDEFVRHLGRKYPHMVGKCLNFLPFDQALKLFKEYT